MNTLELVGASRSTLSLTADQSLVIQAVCGEHKATTAWPAFGDLDRRLARSRQISDLGKVVRHLPDGLLLPLWRGSVRPAPEAEMKLTALGLTNCAGAEDDLALFLRTLRWFAKRELAFEPQTDEVNLRLSGRQLMGAFKLPASRRPDVERLGHLLLVEHRMWISASGQGWDWSFGLNREIRRFTDVRTVDEYLSILEASLAEHVDLMPSPLPVSEVESWDTGEAYRPYLPESLIEEVRQALQAKGWDDQKLGALLEELNDCYARQNAYASHALLRAVLDHIPPLFGQPSFEGVVNNVSWTKTDKQYVKQLSSFRTQADDVLHRQASKTHSSLLLDDLPTAIKLRRLLERIKLDLSVP